MIELIDVTKKYGAVTVYEKLNLSFDDNSVTAILGKSGSGKTTLLNLLAGLTDYEGVIKNLPENVSYVFQEDRLVPGLTVMQNLELVVNNKDIKGSLENAGLFGVEKRYPKELSGGMARRVSILRAFLYDSDLMLLDEPFKDLDLGLKYKIMDYFKEMRKNNMITTVFVTHDIDEAIYLSDRVIVIDEGKVMIDLPSAEFGIRDALFRLMKEL